MNTVQLKTWSLWNECVDLSSLLNHSRSCTKWKIGPWGFVWTDAVAVREWKFLNVSGNNSLLWFYFSFYGFLELKKQMSQRCIRIQCRVFEVVHTQFLWRVNSGSLYLCFCLILFTNYELALSVKWENQNFKGIITFSTFPSPER